MTTGDTSQPLIARLASQLRDLWTVPLSFPGDWGWDDAFDSLTSAADVVLENITHSLLMRGLQGPGRTAKPASSAGIWEMGTHGFLPQFSPMPAGSDPPKELRHPPTGGSSSFLGPTGACWIPAGGNCLLCLAQT